VQVFERGAHASEAGAGIGLAPNATRVLQEYGMAADLRERGAVLEKLCARHRDGHILTSQNLSGTGPPFLSLHRADLQQVLLSKAGAVEFGKAIEGFVEEGEVITARFAGGSTAQGDLLIGADGVGSVVRAKLFGETRPIYRGYQCWRGVSAMQVPNVLMETFGKGMRFGVVPLGKRGTAFWCTANEPEDKREENAKEKLLRKFGDWHGPIRELIESTDTGSIIKTPIYDRTPIRIWSRGRATLLGDAAHPMTPNFGQGGCMAIEDAVILGRCLDEETDVVKALRRYERTRGPRTASIVRGARAYGWMGQWENAFATGLRSALFRSTPDWVNRKSFEPVTSYDVFTVGLKRG
jgi:2-polyprenyl-6-methoxyphenol hydroxylase-like FAD-dependent oxidoreductase